MHNHTEEYHKIFFSYAKTLHLTYNQLINIGLAGDIQAAKGIYATYKNETEKISKALLELHMDTLESTSTTLVQHYKDFSKKNEESFSNLKENLKSTPFAYAAKVAAFMSTFSPSKATDTIPYSEELRASYKTIAPLQRPAKIHFSERVELKSELKAKGRALKSLKKEATALTEKIIKQQTIVKASLEKSNYDERYQDLISTSSCFMNQVTSDQAKLYGNLSALVYQIDQEKKIGKADKKVTKLERQVTLLNEQITLIETWQKTLMADLTTVIDTEKTMEAIRKNIRNVFKVEFQKEVEITMITSFMIDKIQSLQNGISELETQKNQENSAYFAEATKVFGHNLLGSDYEIQGVFHRNNGEFSGVAAYDKEKNELVLSFAGSKSSGDWIKNLFGWNSKLSAKHGLLTNISFHSGFGSHLDDNADSFFSFMHSWMRSYQRNEETRPLKIVGTGHSLGGALAEIFTAATKQLANKHKIASNVGVMTFGAPSTVNSNCLDTYTNLLGGAGNIIRFAHSYDPVPKVVFWKTAPGAVKIEGDNSLFSDVNGTLVLPIRLNPHDSSEYYHAAETVFKQWKNEFNKLQNQVNELNNLKAKEKTKMTEIRDVSEEAHHLLVKLANQDENSADVFEDEYKDYQEQIKSEYESLKGEIETLSKQLFSSETKKLSRQEQSKLLEQAKSLKDKVEEKQKMLKELSQDKAWQPYIVLMDQEFENLQKSLLRLNQ